MDGYGSATSTWRVSFASLACSIERLEKIQRSNSRGGILRTESHDESSVQILFSVLLIIIIHKTYTLKRIDVKCATTSDRRIPDPKHDTPRFHSHVSPRELNPRKKDARDVNQSNPRFVANGKLQVHESLSTARREEATAARARLRAGFCVSVTENFARLREKAANKVANVGLDRRREGDGEERQRGGKGVAAAGESAPADRGRARRVARGSLGPPPWAGPPRLTAPIASPAPRQWWGARHADWPWTGPRGRTRINYSK